MLLLPAQPSFEVSSCLPSWCRPACLDFRMHTVSVLPARRRRSRIDFLVAAVGYGPESSL